MPSSHICPLCSTDYLSHFWVFSFFSFSSKFSVELPTNKETIEIESEINGYYLPRYILIHSVNYFAYLMWVLKSLGDGSQLRRKPTLNINLKSLALF